MIIAVVDGMGGGIGAQIVTQLRQELPLDVEVLALGTNAIATQKMMKAKANRGASGENAIRVSINMADFILAPIGVVIPNSMLGEITPAIAQAVAGARGHKLLLPINALRDRGHRVESSHQTDQRGHRYDPGAGGLAGTEGDSREVMGEVSLRPCSGQSLTEPPAPRENGGS